MGVYELIGKVEGRIDDKLRKQSINEGKCISKIWKYIGKLQKYISKPQKNYMVNYRKQMEMYSRIQKWRISKLNEYVSKLEEPYSKLQKLRIRSARHSSEQLLSFHRSRHPNSFPLGFYHFSF